MGDLPRDRDDTRSEPDREAKPGMPRWVKLSGIIVGALVVLVIILALTGGPGRHGPSRHTGGRGGHPPLTASVAVHGLLPR